MYDSNSGDVEILVQRAIWSVIHVIGKLDAVGGKCNIVCIASTEVINLVY